MGECLCVIPKPYFPRRGKCPRFPCDLNSDNFLFFSSRRRHTRFKCDWSSDVCSSDLVGEANAETLVAIQIETPGALNDLRAICGEQHVDVLYVGPNDLTQSLGIPGQYNHPSYQDALTRIAHAAKDAGKIAWIVPRKTEQR